MIWPIPQRRRISCTQIRAPKKCSYFCGEAYFQRVFVTFCARDSAYGRLVSSDPRVLLMSACALCIRERCVKTIFEIGRRRRRRAPFPSAHFSCSYFCGEAYFQRVFVRFCARDSAYGLLVSNDPRVLLMSSCALSIRERRVKKIIEISHRRRRQPPFP